MYDAPRDLNTFINRAGRTARAGKEGLVTCLMWPAEISFYAQIREGDDHDALQNSGGRQGRRNEISNDANMGATGVNSSIQTMKQKHQMDASLS